MKPLAESRKALLPGQHDAHVLAWFAYLDGALKQILHSTGIIPLPPRHDWYQRDIEDHLTEQGITHHDIGGHW